MRTLEADRASGGPAHSAAIGIGDRDLRVVERRSDVHQAVRDGAALALFLEFFFALARGGGRFAYCVGCCVCRFLCHFVLRFFESVMLKTSNPRHSLNLADMGRSMRRPYNRWRRKVAATR